MREFMVYLTLTMLFSMGAFTCLIIYAVNGSCTKQKGIEMKTLLIVVAIVLLGVWIGNRVSNKIEKNKAQYREEHQADDDYTPDIKEF